MTDLTTIAVLAAVADVVTVADPSNTNPDGRMVTVPIPGAYPDAFAV
jgi:hypothetical protein